MRSDSDDCILMEVLCDERKEYELLTLLIGYLNTYNVHRHQKKKMMELLFDDEKIIIQNYYKSTITYICNNTKKAILIIWNTKYYLQYN